MSLLEESTKDQNNMYYQELLPGHIFNRNVYICAMLDMHKNNRGILHNSYYNPNTQQCKHI